MGVHPLCGFRLCLFKRPGAILDPVLHVHRRSDRRDHQQRHPPGQRGGQRGDRHHREHADHQVVQRVAEVIDARDARHRKVQAACERRRLEREDAAQPPQVFQDETLRSGQDPVAKRRLLEVDELLHEVEQQIEYQESRDRRGQEGRCAQERHQPGVARGAGDPVDDHLLDEQHGRRRRSPEGVQQEQPRECVGSLAYRQRETLGNAAYSFVHGKRAIR